MLTKREDGTYQHEVLVTVKMNRMGDLEIKDTDGKTAYVQGPDAVAANLESVRFINGDMQDLDAGWPVVSAIYDRVWDCISE